MDDVLERRRRVAVIGAGVIGASWVAVFLAHGLEVVVQDPRAGIDAEVHDYVGRAADSLRALGCDPARIASGRERLTFEPDLERAVAEADVVQENGPERIDFKRDLWKRVALAAPAHALLLSSSSALPATAQARDMHAPERMLVGHPFNPPHVIPLVEVVPGERTSDASTQEAMAFYTALGKVPQVVHKEVPGFVANRLQAAIFRECVSLVAQGVVTVGELDAIVTNSVGLRWAVGGPFASFHLGGGDDGMRGFVRQFGGGMESRWRSMVEQTVAFDDATTARLYAQSDAAFGGRTRAEHEAARDARQIAILKVLGEAGGSATHPTTQAILDALANPRSDAEGFDPNAHLERVLAGVGLSTKDGGGAIEFVGRDPIIPSVFRIAAAAGIGLAAKSVAMAALWRARGGDGQDISVDLRKAPHRLCPFYDRKWETINGYVPRNPADPETPFSLSFYETRDHRWVMPLNLYPRLRSAALRFLDCSDDPKAVARAIRARDAAELEDAGERAGIVMPMIRSAEEFVAERHYVEALQDLPLVEVEKIGESDPIPFAPDPSQPLSGIRALGLARVIAGAGTGRALALHGADVLNVWRPTDFEIDLLYATANVGVRSTTLDVASTDGAATMRELLAGADVFYANRRLGFLDKLGLSPREAAAVRPGIVHATVSLHGQTGPWAGRPGFDQSAGCVSGVVTLEGSPDRPKLPTILVVNDYLGAWLLTAGIVSALMRRAREGGSYRVHVSLTRLSAWLYTLGLFDKQYAQATAGVGAQHAYLDPDVFHADTPLGPYRGVTEQTRMSVTPGAYSTVLVPRGSCRPEWLAR